MKNLKLLADPNPDFAKKGVRLVKCDYDESGVKVAIQEEEKITEIGKIPAQAFIEYCYNTLKFHYSENVNRVSYLNSSDEVLAEVVAYEECQDVFNGLIHWGSRGVGGDGERDFFIIHINEYSLEVPEDDYILFLYHSAHILSNLRYSFDNCYHSDSGNVNVLKRVVNLEYKQSSSRKRRLRE